MDESITKRLAFIKYIYKVAIEQSYKAEPLSSISLLTFHDSIESFLQLSSEFRDVGKSGLSFMEYWDIVDGLTQKESMRRLNKARVNLKHYGVLPSKLDIEGYRASATNFFEENVPVIFDIKFSDISLTYMVDFEGVKNDLKKAEDLLKEGKAGNALRKAATAYNKLTDYYIEKEKRRTGSSPLIFSNFGFEIKGIYEDELDNLAREIDVLSGIIDDSLAELQNIIRMSVWGIDYGKYTEFQNIIKLSNVFTIPLFEKKKIPPKNCVQFCIDFVIESAIILQKFYSTEGFNPYGNRT